MTTQGQIEIDTDTKDQLEEKGNYLLEIRTVQSPPFRCLIEALKEILTDANIEFDDTGMKIIAMDASHTVLVHLKLESKNFESYHCPNKLVLGIGMLNFFKLIGFFFVIDFFQKCEVSPLLLSFSYAFISGFRGVSSLVEVMTTFLRLGIHIG